jgi:hypothetical protein
MIGHIRSEEAVSEAIGFIIIFSLVLTGIALVTLYGYPLILKQQISSDERTMEQAMITIQNDMKLLSYSNVPYKDTPLRVAGGALTVFNTTTSPETFSIRWGNASGWHDFAFSPLATGEIRYFSDQGTAVIALQNGAVLKRQQDANGSVMIAEPRWFYDDDEKTFVIFLLSVQSDGMMSLNGIGNIQMNRLAGPDVTDEEITDPGTLFRMPGWNVNKSIRIEYSDTADNYTQAWENYFTGSSIVSGGLAKSGTGAYVLDDVERVVIKRYNVTIDHL